MNESGNVGSSGQFRHRSPQEDLVNQAMPSFGCLSPLSRRARPDFMSETQAERSPPPADPAPVMDPAAATPPLSPAVRRHLGQNLRGHYAESLSAPVNQRLEALIAQLDKPGR